MAHIVTHNIYHNTHQFSQTRFQYVLRMIFFRIFIIAYNVYYIISGFIAVREMSGRNKISQGQGIVREFCEVSGKFWYLPKLMKNIMEFHIMSGKNDHFRQHDSPVSTGLLTSSSLPGITYFQICSLETVIYTCYVFSGKYEYCQGIVREFWRSLLLWTLHMSLLYYSYHCS